MCAVNGQRLAHFTDGYQHFCSDCLANGLSNYNLICISFGLSWCTESFDQEIVCLGNEQLSNFFKLRVERTDNSFYFSLQQLETVAQREFGQEQPEQTAPGETERRAGHTGQSAAVRGQHSVQIGPIVHFTPVR